MLGGGPIEHGKPSSHHLLCAARRQPDIARISDEQYGAAGTTSGRCGSARQLDGRPRFMQEAAPVVKEGRSLGTRP
jgi:hypothetical protein